MPDLQNTKSIIHNHLGIIQRPCRKNILADILSEKKK